MDLDLNKASTELLAMFSFIRWQNMGKLPLLGGLTAGRTAALKTAQKEQGQIGGSSEEGEAAGRALEDQNRPGEVGEQPSSVAQEWVDLFSLAPKGRDRANRWKCQGRRLTVDVRRNVLAAGAPARETGCCVVWWVLLRWRFSDRDRMVTSEMLLSSPERGIGLDDL